MPGRKPDKRELARMKAMNDLGVSPTAIAKKMEKSHNTVIKYLSSDVYNDPDIAKMVERIKEKEIEDLYLLGAKGRKRLHELVDQGDSKMIETIALVDRTFQQRRLLEGLSTANLFSLTALVEAAHQRNLDSFRKQGQKNEAEKNDAEEKVEVKDGKVAGSEGTKSR